METYDSTQLSDRLHLVQTKCLEFQKEAYSLSRKPVVLAYYLRELIALANPENLKR
jgi:hypothetical protein